MHHIDNGFDVFYRCMLQNAMTEIEDMARAAIGAAQDIVNTLPDLWQW
jgi:hypothetical protein